MLLLNGEVMIKEDFTEVRIFLHDNASKSEKTIFKLLILAQQKIKELETKVSDLEIKIDNLETGLDIIIHTENKNNG